MSRSIIFGGTRGIGRSIYDKLSKRGDKLVTISRNKNKRSNHIVFDLLKDNLSKLISNKFLYNKKIDNLIFSHRYRGSNKDDEFGLTIHKVEKILNLLKQNLKVGSSVILIGSIAGHLVVSEQSLSYHVSRAGIESLVRYYAVNYGSLGIRVNCVLPDIIIKEENKEFYKKNNPIRKLVEKITPLGRMGSSNDVANLIEFLSSKKSSFITGQSIFVDGGLSVVSQTNIAKKFLN